MIAVPRPGGKSEPANSGSTGVGGTARPTSGQGPPVPEGDGGGDRHHHRRVDRQRQAEPARDAGQQAGGQGSRDPADLGGGEEQSRGRSDPGRADVVVYTR